MNRPKKFTSQEIHKEKIKILENLDIKRVIKGQYEGYLDENHVSLTSNTETFAAFEFSLNTPEFRNVPIFVRTGKKLEEKRALINVEFKKNDSSLKNNKLILEIQPTQDIKIIFNTKKPHTNKLITQAKLDFCYKCQFIKDNQEAYQKLLEDCFNNDLSSFIKSEELIESWKIVEKIKHIKTNIFKYVPDKLPPQAKKFINKSGFNWIK